MRLSRSLLIIAAGAITAWAVVPITRAQTAATQPVAGKPVATRPAAARPAATQPAAVDPTGAPLAVGVIRRSRSAKTSRHSASRHSQSRPAADAARRSAPTGKQGGVLALGATDITGNKELPKVMAIVPWKDSLGAGGVVKPSDSLMDEVLAPVDRGVFQRQVRYYEQLNGASGQKAPAGQVAPVGDSH